MPKLQIDGVDVCEVDELLAGALIKHAREVSRQDGEVTFSSTTNYCAAGSFYNHSITMNFGTLHDADEMWEPDFQPWGNIK